MSTRSWIGIKQKNQSLNLVYCHYDGYIEHNGLLLQNHYQTVDKIKQLIKINYLIVSWCWNSNMQTIDN